MHPGSAFIAATPGGGFVAVGAQTLLGNVLWTMGAFEESELRAAYRLSTRGSLAVDVGANVGLFTVVMSRAVGPAGRVLAIEPVAQTVNELRENLRRNACTNVDVVEAAAAASSGEVPLTLTDDPALHTAGGSLIPGHLVSQVTTVKAFSIDDLWIAAGRRKVSLVKIDVEGGERAVLEGAQRLIVECRPAFIIEVNDRHGVAAVAAMLPGYSPRRVPGFEPWNYLMVPLAQ